MTPTDTFEQAACLVKELENPLDRITQLVRGISLIAQAIDQGEPPTEPTVPISTIAELVDEIMQDVQERHRAIMALLRPAA